MNNNKSYLDKIFWGVLFILAGVFLILNHLGCLPGFYHISGIKLVLTLVFIWMIISGIKHHNFFMIFLGLALIGSIYAHQLHITAIAPGPLIGAALLVSIGLSIIFPTRHYGSQGFYQSTYTDAGNKDFTQFNSEETLHFQNSFASSSKYVNTDSFVSASFENNFGQMNVYFDNTIIKNGTADINVQNSFGELALFIPKTWNVENHVRSSFGGVKERNQNMSEGCPTLRIYGEVAFGEITITYI